MVGFDRRVGPAGLLMTVIALGLGGCAHDAYRAERPVSYGSLKDDPVTVAKSAAAPASATVASVNMAPTGGPRVLPPLRQATVAPIAPQKPVAEPDPERPVSVPGAPSPVAAPAAQRSGNGQPQVLPPPPEAPLPPVLDAAGVERMLQEGQRLFNQGRVLEARRRFIAAMNGPVPEVLLALARSYDAYYLSRLPAADAAPDLQRALVLYERAVERGAIEANADLERTRGILKVPR